MKIHPEIAKIFGADFQAKFNRAVDDAAVKCMASLCSTTDDSERLRPCTTPCPLLFLPQQAFVDPHLHKIVNQLFRLCPHLRLKAYRKPSLDWYS